MDCENIINALGGRKKVMEMTGLSKGRISQWATSGRIPVSWMKFFAASRPDLFLSELKKRGPDRRAGPDRRKAPDKVI
jgi:hypothetical protein